MFLIQDISFSATACPQVKLTESGLVILLLKGNEAYSAASKT